MKREKRERRTEKEKREKEIKYDTHLPREISCIFRCRSMQITLSNIIMNITISLLLDSLLHPHTEQRQR